MDQLEEVKSTSWWTVLKSLPFSGGPSTTRFVYLAWFAVAALGFLIVVGGFTFVYVHDAHHPAGAGILAVITLMSSVPAGMAANSQNVKNQLTSKLPSATTPGSSTVGVD
jgi:hypothetical protein